VIIVENCVIWGGANYRFICDAVQMPGAQKSKATLFVWLSDSPNGCGAFDLSPYA